MKKLVQYLFILAIIFSFQNLFANKLDNFEAPNYIYLEEFVSSQRSLTKDLQTLLKDNLVFLYVSGCHLDKKALPGFQSLTKRYPKAKFIRISQHSSASNFLLDEYGSFGAPKVFLLYNARIISSMQNYYERINGRFQHIGWKNSISRWASEIYPSIKNISRYKNVQPISSFNYKNVLKNKKVVMLRANYKNKNFRETVKSFLRMAKIYPKIQFALDSGFIPYNQEFSFKYQNSINAFSIIDNVDTTKSLFRLPYRYRINNKKLSQWIKNNFSNSTQKGNPKYNSEYLRKIILSRKSGDLTIIPPEDFKRINKNVIAKLGVRQSFYTLLNAISDSRRNINTAILLINELKYKSKGGIKSAIKNRVIRQKVFSPVIRRAIKYEKNPQIKTRLKNLELEYMKD